MKVFIIFVLCLITEGFHSEKVRYDNHKLFQLTPKNPKAVKILQDLEFSATPDFRFWNSVGPVGMPVDIMVAPSKVNEMKEMANALEIDIKLMMENVQDNIDLQEPRETANRPFGWDDYNNLEQINVWLRTLSSLYPNEVTLIEEVGRSYEERVILGVKVSFDEANANNAVFVESGIHSNEWITPAVSTYILHELLTSNNSTVQEVARRYDWYFVPIFNPDGYVYAHTVDRLWRKTRVPHSVLCTGADPNRNWGYFWGHVGTSNSPCTEIYRGPAAFSEPSCRSLSEYITSIAPRLVGYISFHSYMQLLLLPYGYTSEYLDNYQQMYEIGNKAVEALATRFGTHYYVGSTYNTIYPASGTSMDWVKGTFNIPIVYTYELRDRGEYGFLLPPEQIIPTALETLDSFVAIFIEYENSISGTRG